MGYAKLSGGRDDEINIGFVLNLGNLGNSAWMKLAETAAAMDARPEILDSVLTLTLL